MKKRDIKILAIAAVVLAIALVIVYLFTTYRGPDGLTFKEARMLEKYGAAEITKEELEDAIDIDKYNETIAFYENDPSFGDRVKHFLGIDKDNEKGDKTDGKTEEDKIDESDKIVSDKNDDKDSSDKEDKDTGTDSDSEKPSNKMTYEKYIALSPEKQQEYFESYSDPEDFFKWYNTSKAEYDKEHEADVEGGSIDIGDYMD